MTYFRENSTVRFQETNGGVIRCLKQGYKWLLNDSLKDQEQKAFITKMSKQALINKIFSGLLCKINLDSKWSSTKKFTRLWFNQELESLKLCNLRLNLKQFNSA